MKLEVYSKIGKPFRRNGVTFDTDIQVIDTTALGWSQSQVDALRADRSLFSRELVEHPAPAAKASAKG